MSPRKAIKWKSGEGYTVKRRAKKTHDCHKCGNMIQPNEEYYQLNYYGGSRTYPICENCWTGPKLSARHSSKYKDTAEFATEFKPDTL